VKDNVYLIVDTQRCLDCPCMDDKELHV